MERIAKHSTRQKKKKKENQVFLLEKNPIVSFCFFFLEKERFFPKGK